MSSRIGTREANETMVLAGSVLALITVVGAGAVLLSGYVTPLTFFLPGFFLTLRRASRCPTPRPARWRKFRSFAGTAAGIGVFMQNFSGALFAQLYGLLADGTPWPMMIIACGCGVLSLIVGAIPFR